MTTTDLAPAPEVVRGELVDGVPEAPPEPDPHDENIAALSPCPYCGANANEAPEGVHDGATGPLGRARWHFSHCWRCGFDHRKPANQLVVQGPSISAGLTREIAAQIATQVHAALGLPEGQTLADVLTAIQAAPAHAQVPVQAAPPPVSATDIAREMLRLQAEAAAPPEAATPPGENAGQPPDQGGGA